MTPAACFEALRENLRGGAGFHKLVELRIMLLPSVSAWRKHNPQPYITVRPIGKSSWLPSGFIHTASLVQERGHSFGSPQKPVRGRLAGLTASH